MRIREEREKGRKKEMAGEREERKIKEEGY
jgi:hypothetical protein